MLSRVADSIYWMSRYVERAENIARFINVNWGLMLDMPAEGEQPQWLPLVQVTGDLERFTERYGAATKDNVIQFLVFDTAYENSVLSCLAAARENARTVREIIPTDIWEHINTFYLDVKDTISHTQVSELTQDFFRGIIKESYAFIGMSMTTMTHDECWHFCRVGRMLERADKTSRILDVKYFYLLPEPSAVGTAIDNIQWSALLRSASALQMYRQRYGRISPENVVEYLLLDRHFPRSVRYCVGRVQDSVHAITGQPMGTFSNEAERRCGLLHSELSYAQVSEIIHTGLHEFIDATQVKLNRVGDAIFDTFFAMRSLEGIAASAPALLLQKQRQ